MAQANKPVSHGGSFRYKSIVLQALWHAVIPSAMKGVDVHVCELPFKVV